MALIWDLISLCVCSRGLYNTCSLQLPPHLEKGGQMQFLTNLTLCMTTIYYMLKVVNYYKKVPKLEYLYKLCHNSEFLVTVTYWTLIFFFPHKLNADSFDVDIVLDLQIHLFPYIFLSSNRERLLQKRRHLGHVLNIIAYLGGYWGYVEWIYRNEDNFVYPFLRHESFGGRLLWIVGFIMMSVVHEVCI